MLPDLTSSTERLNYIVTGKKKKQQPLFVAANLFQ